MAEGPIQELGEFAVGVHLHPDVDVEITVRVVEAE
jgi:ribosomal protein L9